MLLSWLPQWATGISSSGKPGNSIKPSAQNHPKKGLRDISWGLLQKSVNSPIFPQSRGQEVTGMSPQSHRHRHGQMEVSQSTLKGPWTISRASQDLFKVGSHARHRGAAQYVDPTLLSLRHPIPLQSLSSAILLHSVAGTHCCPLESCSNFNSYASCLISFL